MSNEVLPTSLPVDLPVDLPVALNRTLGRRGLFRLGGLTVATVAVAAACSDVSHQLGRVGEGGTTPKLQDPVVNDGVYLRTMAGIETSVAAAYQHILDGGFLAKPSATYPDLGDQSAAIKVFQAHHTKAAETYNGLAQESGAEPWTCGNTRLDSAYLTPIFDRIEKGVAKTDSAKEIPASDDATRDYANLVHTLESLSAESAQALMPIVTDPAIRFSAMQIGARSARQAALIALRINPGGYVPASGTPVVAETTTTVAATTTTVAPASSDAPPLTEIPLPLAIPADFGLLSPLTYVGGAGDENGVRLKFNFETPSLNSFAYPFDVCAGDEPTTTG